MTTDIEKPKQEQLQRFLTQMSDIDQEQSKELKDQKAKMAQKKLERAMRSTFKSNLASENENNESESNNKWASK